MQAVLRPTCNQYATAGNAAQCGVLLGLYCGALGDGGPPVEADGGGGCAALAACCPTLGDQKQNCEDLVSTGVAGACDLFRSALCN